MQAFPAPQMHTVRSGPNAIQLAFSWRYQLPALAVAGLRAIAPAIRKATNSSPRGSAV